MQPFFWEAKGKWIIALNVHELDVRGLSGARSRSHERVRMTFDKAWSGDRWVLPGAGFRTFDSEAESIGHIQTNWERMEGAPK
jgi:hypothetical protein